MSYYESIDYRPSYNPQFAREVRERQFEESQRKKNFRKSWKRMVLLAQMRKMQWRQSWQNMVTLAFQEQALFQNKKTEEIDRYFSRTRRPKPVNGFKKWMSDTAQEFCRKNNVDFEELVLDKRNRKLAEMRHRLWYAIHLAHPEKSSIEIGALVQRDGSTVRHALRKFKVNI